MFCVRTAMHIILVSAWQFVTIRLARSDEPLIPLEVSPLAHRQLCLRCSVALSPLIISGVPGRHNQKMCSDAPLCHDRVLIESSPHPTNEQMYAGIAATAGYVGMARRHNTVHVCPVCDSGVRSMCQCSLSARWYTGDIPCQRILPGCTRHTYVAKYL